MFFYTSNRWSFQSLILYHTSIDSIKTLIGCGESIVPFHFSFKQPDMHVPKTFCRKCAEPWSTKDKIHFIQFETHKYRDSLSRSPNNIDNLKGGTEWRYLDNTKHYIFWLCDMKQLTGILTLTVKNSLKNGLVYQGGFGHLSTIPDYFRTFPKATDDSQRLTKRSDQCRRCPKNPPQTLNSIFLGNSKH